MGAYGETIDIFSVMFRRLSDDERILSQALYMRLNTRRGFLWDDPDYGLATDDLLNAGLTSDALVSLTAAIKAECEKDERVSSVAVTPTVVSTDGGYSITPEIRVFRNGGGSFELTGPIFAFGSGALRKGNT